MTTCRTDACYKVPVCRGLCNRHYRQWLRTAGPEDRLRQQIVDGSGVCECPISRPDPKCCRRCGYPCVHRMAPRIRDLAIAKMPVLARQVIDCGISRGAA